MAALGVPIADTTERCQRSRMSYIERKPAPVGGCATTMAWGLVGLGAGLLMFLAWHQLNMASVSKRYGIQVHWVSLLLTFLAFGALVAGAGFAAHRRSYGVSIAVGSFIVAMLGLTSLFILAGVGM